MSSGEKRGSNDSIFFFTGLVMVVVGGYLFCQNVQVTTSDIFRFSVLGRRMDGLIFVPLIASVIFLFYKYNRVTKICCGLSVALILANVIMNLKLHWTVTSLFATIVIFVLLFGGLGLLMKTLFANPDGDHGKKYK